MNCFGTPIVTATGLGVTVMVASVPALIVKAETIGDAVVSATPWLKAAEIEAAPAVVPTTKVAGLLVLVNPPARVKPLGVQLVNVDPVPGVYVQLTGAPMATALPAAGLQRTEDATADTFTSANGESEAVIPQMISFVVSIELVMSVHVPPS